MDTFVSTRSSFADTGSMDVPLSAFAATAPDQPLKFSSPAAASGARQRPVRRFSAKKTTRSPLSVPPSPEQPPVAPPFVFKASGAENVQGPKVPRSQKKPEGRERTPPVSKDADMVADEFTTRLNFQEPQQQQPAPAPFVFGAGVQQSTGMPKAFTFTAQPQPQFPGSNIKRTPAAPRRNKSKRQPVGTPSSSAVPPVKLEYQPTQPSVVDPQLEAVKHAAEMANKYRMDGNNAFSQSKFQDAYALYTKAAEATHGFPALHAELALLLCNRAAASLALQRPLNALHDCRMGLQYHPSYSKCILRMATCYTRMGEFMQARRQAEKASKDINLSRSEVQKKLDEVVAAEEVSKKLLEALSDDLDAFIGLVNQAFNYIPHSETLFAAKAEGLLRLGRLEEAKSAALAPLHMDEDQSALGAPWRKWLQLQVTYHSGNIEKTMQQIQELGHHLQSSFELKMYAQDKTIDVFIHKPPLDELSTSLKNLQKAYEARLKGNASVSSKSFDAAVKAYTEALATPGLSPAMAAVFYSNRAAAYHGLGQISLALADCCRAKALDPTYAKAYSRMASLLEDVKLHSDEAEHLQKALTLRDVDAATHQGYQQRLKKANEQINKSSEPVADHYKLLGVQRNSKLDEIRKAYKKLALQLHPDKAVRALGPLSYQLTSAGAVVQSNSEDRVNQYATWLFKCVGEAHDTLSDSSKRAEYDASLTMSERPIHTHSHYGHGGFYPDHTRSYQYNRHSGYTSAGYQSRSGGYNRDRTSSRGAAPGWNYYSYQ